MSGLTHESNAEDKAVKPRSLKEAIALVKNREAERNDVVVELKVVEHTCLEQLSDDLLPLMTEIDEADDRFDLALTKGDKPRLWIDMTTFVVMGHDQQTYRVMKDTRMGRMVLAETDQREKAADIVAEYVAEKILEREHYLEGEWVAYKQAEKARAMPNDNAAKVDVQHQKRGRSFLWFLLGMLSAFLGLLIAAYYLVPDAF